jgi:histone-lysine N-methyltransferase SETD8
MLQVGTAEFEILELRQVASLGLGVFTKIDLKKGDIVCEYKGDLITAKELKKRQSLYDTNPQKYGSFVFELMIGGKQMAIDATKAFGTVGRMINHSRRNANIYPMKYKASNLCGIRFKAKRQIRKGEQLLYDYGDRTKEHLDLFPWLDA